MSFLTIDVFRQLTVELNTVSGDLTEGIYNVDKLKDQNEPFKNKGTKFDIINKIRDQLCNLAKIKYINVMELYKAFN